MVEHLFEDDERIIGATVTNEGDNIRVLLFETNRDIFGVMNPHTDGLDDPYYSEGELPAVVGFTVGTGPYMTDITLTYVDLVDYSQD